MRRRLRREHQGRALARRRAQGLAVLENLDAPRRVRLRSRDRRRRRHPDPDARRASSRASAKALGITLPAGRRATPSACCSSRRCRRSARLRRRSCSSASIRAEGQQRARLARRADRPEAIGRRGARARCRASARSSSARRRASTQDAFERKLYVIRTRVEKAMRRRAPADGSSTCCSLSTPHDRLQGPADADADRARSTPT